MINRILWAPAPAHRRIRTIGALAATLITLAGADSARAHTMKVDATGLTSTAFFFTDRWYDGDTVETVELDAGTHYLQPGAGLVMRCPLTVTAAGTWAYGSECDSVLAGRGSDTLRLIGHTVTVDASPLSTPIQIANLDAGSFGASPRPVTLLPSYADHYVTPGPGVIADCPFNVALDGTVTYPDHADGCLTGRGTRTVTFNGHAINVDARALSTSSFTILQANGLQHQPSDTVQRYRLLPTVTGYQYGGWTVSGILWPSLGLTIDRAGRIDYPASADGWLSGRHTNALTIRGYTIQIDAAAAAPGVFAVPDGESGWLDRATTHTLTLAPVSYLYFTGEPSDFRFTVREQDGTIEVDRDAAPCAFGSGSTLTVGCRRLTVADVAVDEGASATFKVALSGAAPVEISVDYATGDDSATAPADYAATAGTLRIPAGQTRATIAVPVAGDSVEEPDERFRLTLSNARNATIDDAAALATIRNVDDAATPAAVQLPENVAAPRIRAAGSGVYTCEPGEWRNVGSAPAFTYRWLIRRSFHGRPPTVSTRQTYTPGPSDFGYPITCQVTFAGPQGPVTATSPHVTFSAAGLNTLPPAYGDVRIRGIDVFQTVQPNTGAQMFGYKPERVFDAGLCGGGTPTNYRRVLGLCRLGDRDPKVVDYQGVVLDRDKVTTAIVYVDVAGAAAGDPSLAFDLELSATRAGRVSLGDPVVKRIVNPPRANTPWVESFERDGDRLAPDSPGVPITLPASWTSGGGSIRLHARLRFPERDTLGTAGYGTRQCDTDYCDVNDDFTLNDIPFAAFPALRVASLSLRRITASPPQAPLRAPDRVLARAGALFPGGDRLVVSPFRADLDITTATNLNATPIPGSTDFACNGITYRSASVNNATRACRWDAVAAIVTAWIASTPARAKQLRSGLAYDVVMGVHDYPTWVGGGVEPGAAMRDITSVGRLTPRTAAETPFFTAMATGRPLTAAAHELGHVLTAPHADSDLTPGTCGGNSNGQVGEPWGPDGRGRLQGTRFVYSPPFAGPVGYRTTVDGPYLDATGSRVEPELFDLMSYCAGGDAFAWLSARNWNRFARELAELGTRLSARVATATASRSARTAQPAGAAALAVGVAGPGGGNIMRVIAPSGHSGVPAPDPSSPFTLRSLDGNGRVLLDAGVRPAGSSEAGPAAGGAFAGPVARDAASVELRRGEVVLDRVTRSRPPVVRLLAPQRKTRVRGELTVRWRADDPDGDALVATIAFSPDGRTWRTVYDGPSTGKATIHGSLLPAGARGRIRLRVSDGFAQDSATSRQFATHGTPPRVQIVTPHTGHPLRSGETTRLVGVAYDDMDRPLPDKSLTWFAGRTRLGTGSSVSARLPRGARHLTLVARDRNGRTSSARLPVRVTVSRLRIVALDVPLRARPKARSLTIRIRPSHAAVLTVRGRRFRLRARSTRVRIALPATPAIGILEVPFRLSAKSPKATGTLKGTLSVART